MPERHFDAVPLHVYSQPDHSGQIKLDIRGHMQISAGVSLYKNGEASNIFIGGGYVFGKDKYPASFIMRRDLIRRGVDPGHIFIKSKEIIACSQKLLKSGERTWRWIFYQNIFWACLFDFLESFLFGFLITCNMEESDVATSRV